LNVQNQFLRKFIKSKKDFLSQKVGKTLKITSRNCPILKKWGFFRPKKQAGADLKNKKRIFWAKIDQFRKKRISYQKNKLGLSLRRKKRIFGQKLTNSKKEKKWTFLAKKQAGAELKKKKKDFLAKNWEKIWE